MWLVSDRTRRQSYGLDVVTLVHGTLNDESESRRWSSNSFMMILAA